MSTVLWGNLLVNGKVICDEEDKYVLYKHSEKLNKLSLKLDVGSFSGVQDTTDMQFNLGDDELPEGMESTDEMMAVKGTWISSGDAKAMLEALINHISSDNVRFGFLSNDVADVLSELKQVLGFLNENDAENAKFNFSVVM